MPRLEGRQSGQFTGFVKVFPQLLIGSFEAPGTKTVRKRLAQLRRVPERIEAEPDGGACLQNRRDGRLAR